MVSKEDFCKVWKDSSRKSILNQFYFEHCDLLEAYQRIDKAIDYIKLVSNKYEYLDTIETKELLEILGDKE